MLLLYSYPISYILLSSVLFYQFFVFFFFQAEDGIRDLVRSRGLGDVYKRQDRTISNLGGRLTEPAPDGIAGAPGRRVARPGLASVSYTHLTLPTSDLV